MDLVVLDELGYLLFGLAGGASLFHLLFRLCEHTSVIIVITLTFTKWSAVFGDAKKNPAPLHRLTHHCDIIETCVESYRCRHSGNEAKGRIKPRKQARQVAAVRGIQASEGRCLA